MVCPKILLFAVEQATTIYQKQYTATLEDFIAKYRNCTNLNLQRIVIISEVVAEVKNSLWLEESKIDAEYFQQLQFRDSILMLRFDNKTPYIKQTKMDINLKIIVEKLNQDLNLHRFTKFLAPSAGLSNSKIADKHFPQ